MKRIMFSCVCAVAAMVLMVSCGGDNATPKPRAYLRIDMPQHAYTVYDTAALPFTFECSKDAVVEWKEAVYVDTNGNRLNARKGEKWFDIVYPKYRGFVFLTYKPIRGLEDLRGQVDTAYQYSETHFDHSTGMDENKFVDAAHRLYGTTYHLKGQNVASTYQFWLTDSSSHFLRGSFIVNCTPNNDSLAPVLDFIQADIDHIIESIRWR